jgi:hypothetical protein
MNFLTETMASTLLGGIDGWGQSFLIMKRGIKIFLKENNDTPKKYCRMFCKEKSIFYFYITQS